MANAYIERASTPAVKSAQAANGSLNAWEARAGDRVTDRLTEAEASFIAARDGFFMASVSETGWPYVQHRGGPVGFLKPLDDRTLGFLDFRGNRQYISVGNTSSNDRVALILMDHAHRRRLKLYARLEAKALGADPDLAATLMPPDYKARPERIILLHLEAFDWNCPQHITPRFTEAEVQAALQPVRARLAALEAENQALRAQLS